jgi:hypothetical protein
MELLTGISIEAWFDERIRPLVRFAPESCCGGVWGTAASGLDDHALHVIEDRMRRSEGAPARTALTILVGWRAGYLASLTALGLLRDRVLVEPSRVRMLRSPDGWCADARLDDGARVLVAADHPWSSRADVVTVPDEAALEAEAVAAIGRACAPLVELLACRARAVGVRRLSASVDLDNVASRSLVRRMGRLIESRVEAGRLELAVAVD